MVKRHRPSFARQGVSVQTSVMFFTPDGLLKQGMIVAIHGPRTVDLKLDDGQIVEGVVHSHPAPFRPRSWHLPTEI